MKKLLLAVLFAATVMADQFFAWDAPQSVVNGTPVSFYTVFTIGSSGGFEPIGNTTNLFWPVVAKTSNTFWVVQGVITNSTGTFRGPLTASVLLPANVPPTQPPTIPLNPRIQ